MSKVSDLKKKIERLENKLRQATRTHNVQGKQFKLVKRNPHDIPHSELKNKELNLYDDDKSGERGIILRVGKRKIKIVGEEV